MSDSPFISIVTEDNFEQEVLFRSDSIPVLVDFWAGWCSPCKMLMPILARLAEEYNGKFHLAKVDTDQQRDLAEKYAIRSLPTVKIFKHREIVDEFNGVIPESAIRSLIDNYQFKQEDLLLKEAEEALAKNEMGKAADMLADLLHKDKSNKYANILLAKIQLQKREVDEVDKLLAHITIDNADDPAVKEIRALNEFTRVVKDSPNREELIAQLAESEQIDKRYQLACHNALNGEYEAALDNFLEVMKSDRNYLDDGARKNILAIFEILGGSGPIVNMYRIKLSRLLH